MSEVSIIIPVHNIEDHIHDCLDSVRSQTLRDMEIITVVNGSSDSSEQICRQAAEQDPRIRVICLDKGDLSLARNEGIKSAKSNFVGFVDGDDTIEADMYETMLNIAKHENLSLVCCQFDKVFDNGAHISKFSNDGRLHILDAKEMTMLCLRERMAHSACTMLIDRRLFDNIEFPEGKYFEDRFTLFRLTAACGRGAIINRHYYHYYQRNGSICHSPSYRKWSDAAESEGERLRFILEGGMFTPSEQRKTATRAAKLLIRNLRHLLTTGTEADRANTLEQCRKIAFIPKGTFMGPRILLIRARIKKYLAEA